MNEFGDLDIEDQRIFEFIKCLSETIGMLLFIMDTFFDDNILKEEYKSEKYQDLVLADEVLKNKIESASSNLKALKEEKLYNKIIDFISITGNEVDNLLKECTDFSILYYTLTVDTLLSNSGMSQNSLLQDIQYLVRKYNMSMEALTKYQQKVTIFINRYHD